MCTGEDIKDCQVAGDYVKGQLHGTETKNQARLQADRCVPCWATSHKRWRFRQVNIGQIQVQQGRRGCGKGVGEIKVSQAQNRSSKTQASKIQTSSRQEAKTGC